MSFSRFVEWCFDNWIINRNRKIIEKSSNKIKKLERKLLSEKWFNAKMCEETLKHIKEFKAKFDI